MKGNPQKKCTKIPKWISRRGFLCWFVKKITCLCLLSNYYYNWECLKYLSWHSLVVTSKLPGFFTKPDTWHLGLKLNVSHFYRAIVHYDPCPPAAVVGQNKMYFLVAFCQLFAHTFLSNVNFWHGKFIMSCSTVYINQGRQSCPWFLVFNNLPKNKLDGIAKY